MTVWVVERGAYENRGLAGVYSSLEAAKRAHPKTGVNGWQQDQWGNLDNGLDWDDACDITEYVVED